MVQSFSPRSDFCLSKTLPYDQAFPSICLQSRDFPIEFPFANLASPLFAAMLTPFKDRKATHLSPSSTTTQSPIPNDSIGYSAQSKTPPERYSASKTPSALFESAVLSKNSFTQTAPAPLFKDCETQTEESFLPVKLFSSENPQSQLQPTLPIKNSVVPPKRFPQPKCSPSPIKKTTHPVGGFSSIFQLEGEPGSSASTGREAEQSRSAFQQLPPPTPKNRSKPVRDSIFGENWED